jgi:REDY-like protein HapK
MPSLIVLFNLKDASAKAAYENWALTTDLPTVKNLNSVDDFKVYRMTNLLGSDTPAPYQYCEIIEVNDIGVLFAEIGTPLMQKVAAEFQAFADNPIFIQAERFG